MANNIINLDRKRNRRSRANSARWEKMDRCVLCWHLTNVPQNTPISQRKYYVQGQGQLCAKCYYELCKQGAFFGDLCVVGKSRKRTKMGAYWTCLCSCGYTCEVTASELVSGRKTHCGCKSVKNYATSDITGQRFGRLTAQYSTKKRDAKGFVIWHCQCDCGSEADVSYNSLMYCGQTSCGCKKKEHDKALGGFLTHVDGTSIDALKSRKIPSNNTTGVKGVYLVKGRYLAKIVFQHRQYFLGTYASVEEAAEARKKAEEAINGEVIGFYEKWSEKAAADPVWAKDNPIKISVSKSAGAELRVQLQPDL